MQPIVASITDLEALLTSLPDLNPNDTALITRAFHKSSTAHHGQVRKSGEPYFTHCLAVANILAEMKLDAETIAAALLHDTIEDTEVTEAEIQAEFGTVIANMVVGVTKLTNLPISVDAESNSRRHRDNNKELEYIRKMLLTMGDDVRIVLIKLADRLHNMRTLGYMPEDKQKRIAKETMDIFAPLANRLGIWQFKWELEDLSFRYLEPDAYRQIAASIDERRSDRESYLTEITQRLRAELANYNLPHITISGRPKHIYSIYRKMQRKQLPFKEIYDIRAIRVMTQTIPECYLVLGVVHNLWRPITNEFDDYIAAPKDNFYQSLHTAVIDQHGKTVEVQIRTAEMHQHAEYGVAAHWRYKEADRKHDARFIERLNYLRRLMEFGPANHEDPEDFVDSMKSEVFQDRVYVYTRDGDIVDLPAGSTPIDFAYHIHTEIGDRCRGAKIHGKLVNLSYQLKTGDQVEIIAAKRGGPSMDWLNSDLGFVKTTRARTKIRQWFRKLNRDRHITLGRDVVEREMKRMGVLDTMTFKEVAALFNLEKTDDFLAAVGAGDISPNTIANRMLDEERAQRRLKDADSLVRKSRAVPSSTVAGGINILGTGGLLVNFARCCNPAPGDPITGYITRGRGVTIHRADCANILSLNDPERLIDVSWGGLNEERLYRVPVEIVAYDREGLIRDITTVIADEKINMTDVRVSTKQEIATFHITMEISHSQQLSRILSKISQIKSVVETYRSHSN